MPIPGTVWAANTWDADAWASDTWADAQEQEVQSDPPAVSRLGGHILYRIRKLA